MTLLRLQIWSYFCFLHCCHIFMQSCCTPIHLTFKNVRFLPHFCSPQSIFHLPFSKDKTPQGDSSSDDGSTTSDDSSGETSASEATKFFSDSVLTMKVRVLLLFKQEFMFGADEGKIVNQHLKYSFYCLILRRVISYGT